MRLLAFRVRSFRSVDDSGWIDADQVTAIIGTNDSGKTNVLAPLWKLKPASDGEIDPIADYPRKRYSEIRAMARKPIFIEARFELPWTLVREVAALLRVSEQGAAEATISRDFSGRHYVSLHTAGGAPVLETAALLSGLHQAARDITAAEITAGEEALKLDIEGALQAATALVQSLDAPTIDVGVLSELEAIFGMVDMAGASVPSQIAARFDQLVVGVTGFSAHVSVADRDAARTRGLAKVPSFIYYSNYGNIDSEIYLPHVIDNLNRADLGLREQAKARTLRILFDFVKLSAEEIQQLGQDSVPASDGETPEPEQESQIAANAQRKKERDILLQAASTELTRTFREWWTQGEYSFRFAADGNHFRIWVSDDTRPEDIELEARSSGLQWFLSFCLVFLVERRHAHEGAILLLDEPGLSLHPLAQNDLSAFFDGLAQTNQLLFTTHSPFMLDPAHLDRARAVYIDKQGVTQVCGTLRAPQGRSDRSNSVYAAYAALRMSVADTLLLGCQPVIVEDPSAQHYFSVIKNYLVGKGHLHPRRDLVFLLGGGVTGTTAVCSLMTGLDETLPLAVLDSSESSRQLADALKAGLYQGDPGRVLTIGEFVAVKDASVEDLFPPKLIAKVVDRYLAKPTGLEEDFADLLKPGEALVPQVEDYARKNDIVLEDGWRVEVARRVKTTLLRAKDDLIANELTHLGAWRHLFIRIHPQYESTTGSGSVPVGSGTAAAPTASAVPPPPVPPTTPAPASTGSGWLGLSRK